MNAREWLGEMSWEQARAKAKGMCVYCDGDSSMNVIYQDSLTGDWYWDICTGEWDEYDDDYIHERVWINYCPNCGRRLDNERPE